MSTYVYLRVSSDKQTTENQKFEINQFLERNGINVDYWVNETISGTVYYEKRKLGTLLKKLKCGDLLVCSEISRLGRNLMQIMTILNYCMNKNVNVWTIKDNYRLGSDIQSKILAFAFSLSAEIERNLISQRTKESLLRLKSEGKVLGRPKGSLSKHSKLIKKAKLIQKLLDENKYTKSQIAKKSQISVSSLYRFINDNKF